MNRNRTNTRNKRQEKEGTDKYEEKRSRKNKGNKNNSRRKDSADKSDFQERALNKGDNANDPNYYFTDRVLADQVTQMSFQQLAGLPLEVEGYDHEIPNIVTIALNPSPGVTKAANYGSVTLNKLAGINLAGFKLFQMLSAYTGRVATYGPQDISTAILGLGEIISTTEVIRRMFGVAFTMNMRNRSYPRAILSQGMKVDADDLFTHFSDYRTRFNGIVTMINQLPIPKSIEYLRKCREMYERVFLDDDSDMAQTLIPMPYTTWVLDEEMYEGGTVLKTVPFICPADSDLIIEEPKLMKDYLDILDRLVGAMLNSSTLQVVYTDLLNLAAKGKIEFTHLDVLAEGYSVYPEFNQGFSLQMHNATITGAPFIQTRHSLDGEIKVTSYNDVFPNANTNSLYYNPVFTTLEGLTTVGSPRTGSEVVIDMFNDNPTVEDRVEVTRYSAISGQKWIPDSKKMYDAVLPDHYVVMIEFQTHLARDTRSAHLFAASKLPDVHTDGFRYYEDAVSFASNVDWAPRFYEIVGGTNTLTGRMSGDLNFYTVVDEHWLDKVNQFISLGLYTLR